MTTENDETKNNIIEASNSDFNEYMEENLQRINAKVLEYIKELEKLKRSNINEEFSTAILFHHPLFCNIEELKMTLQQYALEFSNMESTMEEHPERKPTDTGDLNDQNMNPNIKVESESDEHVHFE